MTDPAEFKEETRRLPGNEPVKVTQTVIDFLRTGKPRNFADCIVWARTLFEDRYSNQIKQLLHVLPVDKKSATGNLRQTFKYIFIVLHVLYRSTYII